MKNFLLSSLGFGWDVYDCRQCMTKIAGIPGTHWKMALFEYPLLFGGEVDTI